MLHRNMKFLETCAMGRYRKLLPTEADALRRHLLRLSREERRLRFHGAISDSAIELLCRQIDWFQTVVTGYFVDGVLRGVSQIVLDRSLGPRSAELAVTVETPWQGSGIGLELARRAMTIARNRGARRLVMLYLAENQPMRHIARHLHGALHADGTTVQADLGLGAATPWSLFEELMLDGTGTWLAAADQLLAPARA
jgi:RimJ/RimL family protein N-acetyltransferase